MFINPQIAIDNKWITFPEWMTVEQQQKCIQPNALDFTIDKLFQLDESSDTRIGENKSSNVMRSSTLVDVVDQLWHLRPGHVYDGMSDFYINVPDGYAAQLITRSSFNRCGTFIQSGLYDTGFVGNIGFMIYNMGGWTSIDPHVRIGQIIFVESTTSGKLYEGHYNTQKGQHWSDKV